MFMTSLKLLPLIQLILPPDQFSSCNIFNAALAAIFSRFLNLSNLLILLILEYLVYRYLLGKF